MVTQHSSTELAYAPIDSLQNSSNADFPENLGMLLLVLVSLGLLSALLVCLGRVIE
ncbi:hypothetical protein [Leptolyngbya iicbica]|uniref:Uncharacterized protein n=1 Tax=Lyngbya confervoides BDU141951 TaxID=1574623 RepID=A0A8T6QPQ3_9CYAN|nr:hypothetical protein [Leptolyngbya sp. LK]